MKSHGLFKRARRGPVHSLGAQAAERRYEAREVRSYESEYVNGLWHLDFHHGSLRVLRPDGQWAYPILHGVLDDHSRLCCHLQWYLAEGARELCHGLSQAFQKRDLPRCLLFDYVPRHVIKIVAPSAVLFQAFHHDPIEITPDQFQEMNAFSAMLFGGSREGFTLQRAQARAGTRQLDFPYGPQDGIETFLVDEYVYNDRDQTWTTFNDPLAVNLLI
jgi:hypothetical protein